METVPLSLARFAGCLFYRITVHVQEVACNLKIYCFFCPSTNKNMYSVVCTALHEPWPGGYLLEQSLVVPGRDNLLP
jgi:hypothetical protein